MSDIERLTVLGGEALDRAVARLGRGLSSVNLSTMAPNLRVEELLQQHQKLLQLRKSGTVEELLVPPSTVVMPHIVPIHGFLQGDVCDLHFESPFPAGPTVSKSVMGSIQKDFDAYQLQIENQRSFVRLWQHRDDASAAPTAERRTIVAIHGWTMGDQRVNSLAFLPGLFFSLGWNVALVELPFHGRRAPANSTNDLPLFPNADPIRTFLSAAHAIRDLRQLRLFLETKGLVRVSSVAMSLGGYIGHLWSCLDRLERSVLIVPLVSMGDLAWELIKGLGQPRGPGITKAFFRDLFRDSYALDRPSRTPEASYLVLGGRGDQVVSREQLELFRSARPGAAFSWFSGGHGAHLKRGQAFERMRNFLSESPGADTNSDQTP